MRASGAARIALRPNFGSGASRKWRKMVHMTQPSESTLPAITWLKVEEVADYFRINKMSVYRMIESGTLAAVQIGRSYRIDQRAVEAYLAKAAVK